jgi:serine/threonine protein kinase
MALFGTLTGGRSAQAADGDPTRPEETRASVEFLAQQDGFRSIPAANLSELTSTVDVNHYAAGDYLMRRGEQGDSMHVVRRGKVRIPILHADGRPKWEISLGVGAIIGEMALLTGAPRHADVIAESDVVTYSFSRQVIQPLLEAHPPLAQFLTAILAQRIEQDQALKQVGSYRIGRKLGEGATAKVYEATHDELSRLVALKMLSHALAYDREFTRRFRDEAQIIAGLDHPNVVQVYDLVRAYGTHFIVMEKVDGASVDRTLTEKGRLPPAEARSILRQIASALAAAHAKGIVHRDVKPANCLLGADGRAKLMDFGIALNFTADDSSNESIAGSPGYMAPEVVLGKVVDGRADIYALGATAFKLCTGQALFPGRSVDETLQAHVETPPPDLRAQCPELPDDLAAFVDGALIKDPERRLSDWDEIFTLLGPHPFETGWQETRLDPDRCKIVLTYPNRHAEKVMETVKGLAGLGVRITSAPGNGASASASGGSAPPAGADDDIEITELWGGTIGALSQ